MCSTHLDLQLQHALLEAPRQLTGIVWVQVEVAADAVLQAAVLAASALKYPAGSTGGGRRGPSTGEGVLTEVQLGLVGADQPTGVPTAGTTQHRQARRRLTTAL